MCIARMGRLDRSPVAKCCVCAAVFVVYKVRESTKAAVVMQKEWCAPKAEGLMKAKRRGTEICTTRHGGFWDAFVTLERIKDRYVE